MKVLNLLCEELSNIMFHRVILWKLDADNTLLIIDGIILVVIRWTVDEASGVAVFGILTPVCAGRLNTDKNQSPFAVLQLQEVPDVHQVVSGSRSVNGAAVVHVR